MSRQHHGRKCRDISLALAVFRGGCSTDLPDDIALHVEECPACMGQFELLFPPLQFEVPAKMLPPRPRAQGRSAVAVAAIGLLALGMTPQQQDADPFAMLLHEESALTFEEMIASDQECPLIPGESDPPVCVEDDGEWM